MQCEVGVRNTSFRQLMSTLGYSPKGPRRILPRVDILPFLNPDVTPAPLPRPRLRQSLPDSTYVSHVPSSDDPIPEHEVVRLIGFDIRCGQVKEELFGIIRIEQWIEVCSDVKA